MKGRSWSFSWVKLDLHQWTTITLISSLISLNTWDLSCLTGSLMFILSTNFTLRHFSSQPTLLTIFSPFKPFIELNFNLLESQLYGLLPNMRKLIKSLNFLTLSTFVTLHILMRKSFKWKAKYFLRFNLIFSEPLLLASFKSLKDILCLEKKINFLQDIYLRVFFLM